MKAPVCRRTAHGLLRLGLLVLAFVCVAHSPAAAQTCAAPGCVIIFTGDDIGNSCFTLNRSELSCPVYSPLNTLTSHVDFGQTVDFYQPSNLLFGAHTATSGTCCTGSSFFFRIPLTGTMMSGQDNYVIFDGRTSPGGPLNAGTYNYYCIPHGNMMKGVLIADPDATTTALTVDFNPSVINQTVTFTATVSSMPPSGITITPTGTVTFYDGATAISSALPLSPGTPGSAAASFSTSLLSAGNHSITAKYNDPASDPSPTPNFLQSTSNVVPQAVQDFSIIPQPNPSNWLSGTALPCPAGPPCPLGQYYDYMGTVTAINGYAAQVTISCAASATLPPSSCVVTGNPVSMGGSFTVRASNTAVTTSALNFTIQAASNSGSPDTHSAAATLNVGSFNFTALNPSTVSAARGNSSAVMSFQVSSSGPGFSGEVDMSCTPPPPTGVTCFFSNGLSTHALYLAGGQTINDTLVLDTNNAVPLGANTITVKATPAAAPGQFISHTVTLNETAPTSALLTLAFGDANKVTLTICNGTPGSFPPGTCLLHTFPPPVFMGVGGVSEPNAVGVSNNSGQLVVSAVNGEATQNSDLVQLNFIFDHPVVFSPAPSIYFGGVSDSCPVISPTQVTCNLNTITAAAPKIKTVVVSIKPLFYRTLRLTMTMSETESNPGVHIVPQTVQVRPRPLVHNKVPPKIP